MSSRIIEFLRNRNDFVSGEEISKFIGITRAGIWKKVNTLRQKGYLIEAVPSKGYRLLSSPDVPTKEEIRAVFKGDIIGREVYFYDVIASTNEKAMQIGLGEPAGVQRFHQGKKQRKKMIEGTVVIADAQEQGRGRFGRNWISPPRVNLYFTVLFEPFFSPKEASILTLMAAVAVVSAIRDYVGLNAVIKWPNDILIRDKKVGGILTEMKSDLDRVNFVAVGIGINVNMPLSKFPKDVRSFASSLKEEKGKSVDRVELLGVILAKLEYWYKSLLKGKRKALLNEWLNLNSTTGNRVKVKSHNRTISGVAEGVGDDGELVLRLSSGAVEKVYAGEVTVFKGRDQGPGHRD